MEYDSCGRRMKIFCVIKPLEAIGKILDCLGFVSSPLISQLHHGDELAHFIAEEVFVLKSVRPIFHHRLGKLPMEIMAADSESIGQDIYAVDDQDLSQVHRSVGEDLFDC